MESQRRVMLFLRVDSGIKNAIKDVCTDGLMKEDFGRFFKDLSNDFGRDSIALSV